MKQPVNMVTALDRSIGYWDGGCGCVLRRSGLLSKYPSNTHTLKNTDPELGHSCGVKIKDILRANEGPHLF